LLINKQAELERETVKAKGKLANADFVARAPRQHTAVQSIPLGTS
jgi:hypothetical protein